MSSVPIDSNTGQSARDDLLMITRWVTLGLSAGAMGGLIAGGVGGRLAMFLLRLTTGDSVNGRLSDDGFVIGRFDAGGTLQLLAVTTVLGCFSGLFVVAGRPFFPRRGMPLAWGAAGATIVGSIIIKGDGIDFTLLHPQLLAVALFIAIPGIGALLIAALVEAWSSWWWVNRKRTAVMVGLAAPGIVIMLAFIAPAIVILVVGGLWLLALRVPAMRDVNLTWQARSAALGVYALLVGLGSVALARDVHEILL